MKENGVQLFKSLTSKIHPPLPRTPRASQQLLNLLSSSFRRQLDKEHPPIQPAETTDSSQNDKAYSASLPGPTDDHMRTILEHPLFTPPSYQVRDRSADQRIVACPLSVLDRALAAGTADFELFRQCIESHWFSMLGIPDAELCQKLRSSGVSKRVESWLLSSELPARGQLFRSFRTVALLMPYLVCEKRQTTVLEWLKGFRLNTVRPARPGPISLSGKERNLIAEFVAAEIKYGDGINGAMKFYIRLHRVFAARDKTPHGVLSDAYIPPMDTLIHRIVSSANNPNIDAKLFDHFRRLHNVHHEETYFWGAFLPVYHPVTPSASPALKYLRSGSLTDDYPKSLVSQVCLAAAELCIKQERHADASWLIKYTKKLLPPSTDSKTPPVKERFSHYEISRRLAPAFD